MTDTIACFDRYSTKQLITSFLFSAAPVAYKELYSLLRKVTVMY